jgi:hypothetical protein
VRDCLAGRRTSLASDLISPRRLQIITNTAVSSANSGDANVATELIDDLLGVDTGDGDCERPVVYCDATVSMDGRVRLPEGRFRRRGSAECGFLGCSRRQESSVR